MRKRLSGFVVGSLAGAVAVLAVVQRSLKNRLRPEELAKAGWAVGADALHGLAALLRPRSKV